MESFLYNRCFTCQVITHKTSIMSDECGLSYRLVFDQQEYLLTGMGMAIGRSQKCDIILAGGQLAKIQAHLLANEQGWLLYDAEEGGELLVNGEPTKTKQLATGDIIAFNDVDSAVFMCGGDGEEPIATSQNGYVLKARMRLIEEQVGKLSESHGTVKAEVNAIHRLVSGIDEKLTGQIAEKATERKKLSLLALWLICYTALLIFGLTAVQASTVQGDLFKSLRAAVLQQQGATSLSAALVTFLMTQLVQSENKGNKG